MCQPPCSCLVLLFLKPVVWSLLVMLLSCAAVRESGAVIVFFLQHLRFALEVFLNGIRKFVFIMCLVVVFRHCIQVLPFPLGCKGNAF